MMDTEAALKFIQLGPCLKPGREVWMVRAGRLQVGTVIKIDEEKQVVTLRTREGDIQFDPMSSVLFAQAPGQKKITHKRKFTSPPATPEA